MRQSNEQFYQSLSRRERALFDVLMVIADTLFQDTARYSLLLNTARFALEASDKAEAFDMADTTTKH